MSELSVTVKGQRFDVSVTHGGEFRTTVGEVLITSKTFDGLKPLIEKSIKAAKVKVEIPISVLTEKDRWTGKQSGGRINHGVLTGMHSSHRNPLIKLDGQKAGEYHTYGTTLLKRLPDEVAEELLGELNAIHASERRISEIKAEYKLDARSAVAAVLKEAGVA